MSDINKKIRDVEQDLDFLNGEVSRTKEIKNTLEEEIISLGIIQKTKDEEYKQKDNSIKKKIISLENILASKQLELDNISKEVITKNTELSELNILIEKNKTIISDTLSDFASRESVLKEKEEKNNRDIGDIMSSKKDIELHKQGLETIKEYLKDTEKSLNTKKSELEKKELELTSREENLKKVEKDTKNSFNINAARSNEISEQSEKLRIDKIEFEAEKQDILNKKARLREESDFNSSKSKELKEKEVSIDERDRVSIIREQKSILKEEELKIREKRISIKEQQND